MQPTDVVSLCVCVGNMGGNMYRSNRWCVMMDQKAYLPILAKPRKLSCTINPGLFGNTYFSFNIVTTS